MHPGTRVEPLTADWARSGLELSWRWLLIVGWLVLLVATVTTGVRDATWQELRTAVAEGDVTEVSTTTGLPPHVRGSGPVEITWRDGLVRYRTTVREARPVRPSGRPGVVPDVDAALVALQPGLTVDHPSTDDLHFASSSVFGWQVSQWLLGLALALGLFTFVLLVTQPPPWRATRWAWFWLFSSPLGLAAYLLLSGPTGLVPAPRDPSRRLTGGWAFLLAIVVSALSRAVVGGLT